MVEAKIDTSRFERDFALYLKETSKTQIDAFNYKLFDATREAIKQEPKADRNTVKESLDARANLYPDRTVAEMLVIIKEQSEGVNEFDLDAEVKAFKGKRLSSIAFTKGGWIPALKKLLPLVKKESVSVGAGTVRESFGGADPAHKTGGTIVGSTFNDVEGTGNKTLVEHLKTMSAQAGIDKVSMDMETYLSKKLDIPIEQFNKS